MTGRLVWKSPAGGACASRHRRAGPLTRRAPWPARTIVTVRTGSGSFSFQPVDLETGPISRDGHTGSSCVSWDSRQPNRQPSPRSAAKQVGPPPAELLTAKIDAIEGTTAVSGWGASRRPASLAQRRRGTRQSSERRDKSCRRAALPYTRGLTATWRLVGEVPSPAWCASRPASPTHTLPAATASSGSIVHDAKTGRKSWPVEPSTAAGRRRSRRPRMPTRWRRWSSSRGGCSLAGGG